MLEISVRIDHCSKKILQIFGLNISPKKGMIYSLWILQLSLIRPHGKLADI